MKKSFVGVCTLLILLVMCTGCKIQKVALPESTVIKVDSEPRGAKVVFNGEVVCEATPAEIVVPLTIKGDNRGFASPGSRVKRTAELNALEFKFILPGYETATETIQPDVTVWPFKYPSGVFHLFTPSKPIQSNGANHKEEAPAQRVSRDNPGATKMEDAIIRWYFDSDPRGARIFWRVISSVPAEVKNTNETYLTSTPYEETRGFNIEGLTYENSKNVTIEIKVTKRGYIDQVKRFNVRQALDQQEISGFFELVPQD